MHDSHPSLPFLLSLNATDATEKRKKERKKKRISFISLICFLRWKSSLPVPRPCLPCSSAMVLKSLIRYFLNRYLKNYIQTLDDEKFDFDLRNGSFTLLSFTLSPH